MLTFGSSPEQVQGGQQEGDAEWLLHYPVWDSWHRPQQGDQEARQRSTAPSEMSSKNITAPPAFLTFVFRVAESVQIEIRKGKGQVDIQPDDRSSWCSTRHERGQEPEQRRSPPPLLSSWKPFLPYHYYYAVLWFSPTLQVSYKKDAKAGLHYTTIADRPDIKKATQAAKLISDVIKQHTHPSQRLSVDSYRFRECCGGKQWDGLWKASQTNNHASLSKR